MSKLKYFILIALFIFGSLKYGSSVRDVFTQNTNKVIASFLDIKKSIEEEVNKHLFQAKEIERLREENRFLK
ncbi:MAG TPA: hypothetical protein CFH79_07540, partial [Sulfurospirillum sp. UBA11407]